MSQSGYTPILIYGSTTASNVPLAANLTTSASGVELAINAADGKLYYKNSSGVVTLLSASGGGPAGGSNTQVQFNSSGVLAGSASFTWDGTTLVTPSHTTNTATTGSTNKGPLNYGTLSFSDTGIVQSAQTSVNSYFQNVIQNTSAGTAASAEFIAYNDQGTASTNYATVGINSSGYTGTGSINAPGYAYFLSASTDLVLGTIGANGIHFTINSSATDALAISSAGAVSLPGGTANGVAYLNGSKVVTTGSALTFDGTTFGATKIATNGATGTGLANGEIGLTNSAAIRWRNGANSGYVGAMYIDSSNNMNFDSGGSVSAQIWGIAGVGEAMRLTSTGLGIGTSSPARKLDVAGTTYGVNQINGLRLNNSSAVAANYFDVLFGLDGVGNPYGSLQTGNQANSYLTFFTGSGPTERMRLDSSGNLGLGVTPSAWSASVKALQVSPRVAIWGDAAQSIISHNMYTGGGDKYIGSGFASLFTQINGAFQFLTAPSGTAGNAITFTQAMTLDASGNLLVAKTASSDTTVGLNFYANGAATSTLAASTNVATSWATYSTGAGAYRFYVDMGGTVHATSIVITAISDQRLKENVRDIDTGLNAIMALKPRRFDWKDGKGQDKKNAAGFIAQEFEEVFPESVGTTKAGGDGIEYKNINHETLIPTLVKAIQEQQALIEQLTSRLAAAGI